MVSEEFKKISINEDTSPDELLKFCDYLSAVIDKKYDHAGKEKEQLFQLKLNLSSLTFELKSLIFSESEKESERTIQELHLLTDEEEVSAMEGIQNIKKIVDLVQRKVNNFLELETLTAHWKEVAKQKLLDLYLKERPFLDKSLFKQKNGLLHLDEFHLSRIAMLAEDNYSIAKALEQFNFCKDLETILTTDKNPISKKLDSFFQKLRTGNGRFLTQDEHCQKILKIWIEMITGVSSQRFVLFAPHLLISKFLQHTFKENETSIGLQKRNL